MNREIKKICLKLLGEKINKNKVTVYSRSTERIKLIKIDAKE